MPTENAPFGFMPIRTRSGAKQPQYEIREGAIPSGYGTAMYTNQMIKLVTGGTIQPAAAGDRVLGTFAGCEFVDSDGRVRVSSYWPASQTILTGTSVTVYYYSAQETVYRVQADGTLAITSVGDQADLSNATDANTTAGLSQQTLSTTLAGAAGNAQFRILKLGEDVDNAWGDTYVIVDVEISEHQYTADVAAI
jgi:hypothetical protein